MAWETCIPASQSTHAVACAGPASCRPTGCPQAVAFKLIIWRLSAGCPPASQLTYTWGFWKHVWTAALSTFLIGITMDHLQYVLQLHDNLDAKVMNRDEFKIVQTKWRRLAMRNATNTVPRGSQDWCRLFHGYPWIIFKSKNHTVKR